MTRFYIFIILLSFFVLLQSCAITQIKPERQDPLIGKMIDTRTAALVTFEALIEKISTQDVIYLSEKHNNTDHHLFQQQVILALIEKGMTPVIGFEFFSMEDTPDLLNFTDAGKISHSADAQNAIEKDLRKKLGWDSQSDEMWQFYFDLLSIARDHQLDVAGIDIPTTLKRRITRKGIDGLNPLEKNTIYSTNLDDAPYKAYMFDMFKAVHCGMGHGKMQQRLYDTWVARNDKMALSISQLYQLKKGPVVIIIGGGHTEYGLGVVDRLSIIDPDISQVNIALKEIRINPAPLSDYLTPLTLEGHDLMLPADFLRFSQRVSYENPCEAFKEQLKKMKARPKE